jgi:hypothetical protein
MIPVVRMGLEPEELGEVFYAGTGPTAALTLEASIDLNLDIFFDHSAAAAHRSDPAANRTEEKRPIRLTVAASRIAAQS